MQRYEEQADESHHDLMSVVGYLRQSIPGLTIELVEESWHKKKREDRDAGRKTTLEDRVLFLDDGREVELLPYEISIKSNKDSEEQRIKLWEKGYVTFPDSSGYANSSSNVFLDALTEHVLAGVKQGGVKKMTLNDLNLG